MGGVRGRVGDDDDIVTQTPRTISSSRYLQYFRDIGPFYIVTERTSGLYELDLEISEGFRQKTPNWVGGSLFRG